MKTIGEQYGDGSQGRFVFGDAYRALSARLPELEKQASVIYLDPPFVTGRTFSVSVQNNGRTEQYPAYSDEQALAPYLQRLRSLLRLCWRILSAEGSLYLHCDWRSNAHLRLMMDQMFGASRFANEIIWHYASGGRSKRYFPHKHDSILCYQKSGRRYFSLESVALPAQDRPRHLKKESRPDGRLYYSIRSGDRRYQYAANRPLYPDDVWSDIPHLNQRDPERCGYPTQKPLALISRIICSSSRPGDLVLDPFSGSGSTALAAWTNGRRFLAVDRSPQALRCFRNRMLQQQSPAQFRVEYDIALPQRNPASRRAVEQRLSGRLYDGTFHLDPCLELSLAQQEKATPVHLLCDVSGAIGMETASP